MEARRRLRKEGDRFGLPGACNPEVLNVSTGQTGQFLPPIIRREVQISGPDQVADAAALVGLFDSGPYVVKFLLEVVRFVRQHQSIGQQVEKVLIGAGNRRVKLPAWKDSDAARAHGLFDDLCSAGDAFS